MLKRKRAGTSLRELLRMWERVKNGTHVHAAAARTAAYLSQVHDVPSEVLDSLNKLLSYDFADCGQAIYDVVAYLRRLGEVERLGFPDSSASSTTRK